MRIQSFTEGMYIREISARIGTDRLHVHDPGHAQEKMHQMKKRGMGFMERNPTSMEPDVFQCM